MIVGALDVPLTNPLEAVTQYEPDAESPAKRAEFNALAEVTRTFQQRLLHSQQQQPTSAPREARCLPTSHSIYYRAHHAEARYTPTTSGIPRDETSNSRLQRTTP
ncbi:hypothetical protein ACLOJK_027140 [Asimina triloba]